MRRFRLFLLSAVTLVSAQCAGERKAVYLPVENFSLSCEDCSVTHIYAHRPDPFREGRYRFNLRKSEELKYDVNFSARFIEQNKKYRSEILSTGSYRFIFRPYSRYYTGTFRICLKSLNLRKTDRCRTFNTSYDAGEHRFEFSLHHRARLQIDSERDFYLAAPLLYKRQILPVSEIPPNIIIVLSDTTRRDSLSVYNPDAYTPALKKFSDEALVFNRAVSNSTWTRPSFHHLLTGRYNYETGVNVFRFGVTPPEKKSYHRKVDPLSLKLKQYRDIVIMHNIFGLETKRLGIDTGFTEVHNIAKDGEQTERAVDLAQQFFSQNSDMPFFMLLHINEPHVPYLAEKRFLDPLPETPRPFTEMPAFRRYLAVVSYVDDAFSRVIHSLKEHRLYDEAVIIFTADHGEKFDERHKLTHTIQHRKPYTHGSTPYDEEINIPLLIKDPRFRAETFNRPVQLIALNNYLQNIDRPGFKLRTWLKEKNRLPFFIESRMQHAWLGEKYKLIYTAPGYAARIPGAPPTLPYMVFDRENDPDELKPLPAYPETESFRLLIGRDRRFRDTLTTHEVMLPAGETVTFFSRHSLYSYQSDCSLDLNAPADADPMNPLESDIRRPEPPESENEVENDSDQNNTADAVSTDKDTDNPAGETEDPGKVNYSPAELKNLFIVSRVIKYISFTNNNESACKLRVAAYPFTIEQFSVRFNRSDRFQTGPAPLVLRNWPSDTEALALTFSGENAFFIDKQLPYIRSVRLPYTSDSGQKQVELSAEVQGILKTWGYVQ